MADVKGKAKEDMKVIKFKVLVEELHQYLDWAKPFVGNESCRNLPYYPVFIDDYIQNKYVVVVKELICSMPDELQEAQNEMNGDTHIVHNALEYIRLQEEVVISFETKKGNHYKEWCTESCKDFNDSLIFWLLFLAAVNEDIYNNELSSIIDLAYCLNFDVPMIRDWCHGVEYVLLGNHLTEECDLQCETDEGSEFFLHNPCAPNDIMGRIHRDTAAVIRNANMVASSVGL